MSILDRMEFNSLPHWDYIRNLFKYIYRNVNSYKNNMCKTHIPHEGKPSSKQLRDLLRKLGHTISNKETSLTHLLNKWKNVLNAIIRDSDIDNITNKNFDDNWEDYCDNKYNIDEDDSCVFNNYSNSDTDSNYDNNEHVNNNNNNNDNNVNSNNNNNNINNNNNNEKKINDYFISDSSNNSSIDSYYDELQLNINNNSSKKVDKSMCKDRSFTPSQKINNLGKRKKISRKAKILTKNTCKDDSSENTSKISEKLKNYLQNINSNTSLSSNDSAIDLNNIPIEIQTDCDSISSKFSKKMLMSNKHDSISIDESCKNNSHEYYSSYNSISDNESIESEYYIQSSRCDTDRQSEHNTRSKRIKTNTIEKKNSNNNTINDNIKSTNDNQDVFNIEYKLSSNMVNKIPSNYDHVNDNINKFNIITNNIANEYNSHVQIINTKNHKEDLIMKYESHSISSRDLKTFKRNSCLNDSVINALTEITHNQQDDMDFLSSHFLPLLTLHADNHISLCLNLIKNLNTNNIFGLNNLFIINDNNNNNHWMLHVVQPKNKNIIILDSIGSKLINHDNNLRNIIDFLKITHDEIHNNNNFNKNDWNIHNNFHVIPNQSKGKFKFPL